MEDIETGSESIESGASSEGSSSEASGSETVSTSTQGQSSGTENKQDTVDWSKAFEHPRFKELVDQKNGYQKQYQDIESKYKELQQQLSSIKEAQPKPVSEMDKALEDLKQVHPGLAAAVKQALDGSSTAQKLQERLEAFERQAQEQTRQQVLSSAVGKINTLHEVNKMSDFGKQFINNQLDLAYRAGKLDASDLKSVESAYAEASKTIKAFEESLKRDITKSYVESKQKDASVPTSIPKGAQPKAKEVKVPAFKSKDDLRSAVVQSYLKSAASEKAANNT